MKKIAIVVLLIVFCVVFLTGCSKKEKEEKKADKTIKIILYKTGTEEIIREINIVNTEAINKLNEYLASIEPLKEEEMVNLVLPQEISIIYNDNVSVGMQKGEEEYCYYINKEKGISSLSRIPEGMYEMVIKLVNNGK